MILRDDRREDFWTGFKIPPTYDNAPREPQRAPKKNMYTPPPKLGILLLFASLKLKGWIVLKKTNLQPAEERAFNSVRI